MNKATDLAKSGKKHLDDGNYNDALSFFDQALSLEPTNPDFWNLKGVASVSYTHLTLPTKA